MLKHSLSPTFYPHLTAFYPIRKETITRNTFYASENLFTSPKIKSLTISDSKFTKNINFSRNYIFFLNLKIFCQTLLFSSIFLDLDV